MAIKQVRVKINDVWTVLTAGENGTYSATLAAPNITSYNVNDGHYYPITVEATNMADTVTTINDTDATFGSNLRLYVKEIIAPTITFTAPTEGQYASSSTPPIIFSITDEANGSGVKISSLKITLDSVNYTNTSSGVTVKAITNGYDVRLVPTTALEDGSHTVTIQIEDNDGNKATATRNFTTDTVAPTLNITSPSSDGTYVSNNSLTVAGTTSDSTSGTPAITIKLNGVDQGNVTVSNNGSFSKAVTLVQGENTIVITATDLAGKTTTITRTINLDSSAPTIASITINPNPVNVGASYMVTVVVTE